ncbi:MAG: aromatic amino acid lyase [Pseudonocardiaceae bacterium]
MSESVRSELRYPPERLVRICAPEDLDAGAIVRIAGGDGIVLDPALLHSVGENRAVVLAALTGESVVYGVSTGVGRFASYRLDAQAQAEHQHQLLAGRSVGGPPWLPAADVRAVMAIKLRALLAPETGASAELCRYLADRINDRLIAAVPCGGIGCSGEIIPLCHAFQTLVGLGEALEDGTLIAAVDALARRGVAPYRAGPKEGLALIEGAPVATMHAILRGGEALRVAHWQLFALAFTVDASGAPRAIYDSRIAGGVDDVLAQVLGEVRRLSEGGLVRTEVVQAPVSVRVGPQALAHLRRVIDDLAGAARRGLGVVTDSPAWLMQEFVSSAGFHAAELGLRLDAVAAALVHVAEISVQRMHRLLDDRYTGLPPQLAAAPGRQVGLAAVHKRATGELHTMRRLATPATLGSIDTSAGQEDVQAFACAAGEQLRAVIDGLFVVTACELIAAVQACRLRCVEPAPALRWLRDWIAHAVPLITDDRPLGPEIASLTTALRSREPQSGDRLP